MAVFAASIIATPRHGAPLRAAFGALARAKQPRKPSSRLEGAFVGGTSRQTSPKRAEGGCPSGGIFARCGARQRALWAAREEAAE